MGHSLQVLIAEDNPTDAELLVIELRRAGFDPKWERVETEAEYAGRLAGNWDLIISDYEMPQFNGLQALEILKASGLDIPFLIVSGTIGEDTAVAAMKQGATDYLLKDRLGRLGGAINHALEEKRLRLERWESLKALQESEERLHYIFVGFAAFVGLLSVSGRVLELNQAALLTAALKRDDIIGRRFVDGPWWKHSPEMRNRVAGALTQAAAGIPVQEELVAEVTGGHFMVVEATFNPLRDASGRITQIVGSGVDVTKRQRAERKIREQLDELLRWQEVMLNREDRVHALKAEVNELLARLQLPERYATSIPS